MQSFLKVLVHTFEKDENELRKLESLVMIMKAKLLQILQKNNADFRKNVTKILKFIKILIFIRFYEEEMKGELEKNVIKSEERVLTILESVDPLVAFVEIGFAY